MEDTAAAKRTLRLVAASFAGAAVTVVVALALVDLGEPESPDLAAGAALAVAILGVVGLLVALRWWATSRDRVRSPANLQVGFIVRVAVAEFGLFLGVLALVLTGSITPMIIGLALFLGALSLLALSLDRS